MNPIDEVKTPSELIAFMKAKFTDTTKAELFEYELNALCRFLRDECDEAVLSCQLITAVLIGELGDQTPGLALLVALPTGQHINYAFYLDDEGQVIDFKIAALLDEAPVSNSVH